MKFILTILSGVVVGIVVAYFAQDWKEEKLIFTLTEPAKFGDISFQNLEIRNEGFDPATNVKVYLPKDILQNQRGQLRNSIWSIKLGGGNPDCPHPH